MSAPSTRRLSSDAAGLSQATALLHAGGLVAFPTETVYGLGADARNEKAVRKIFAAKGRPDFNPLIVHVADIGAARRLVEWSALADNVARAFWPGPLTLVLPLRSGAKIAPSITAGLATLAVRLPAAPTASALLRSFGGPIAAPSANPSGQVSPTDVAHVLAGLDGRIDAVLDAGPCSVGVESTILALVGHPTLLRPGGITAEAIEAVIGAPLAARRDTSAISAPGQLRSHYAPRARLRLNATDWRRGEARLGFDNIECDENLSPAGDLGEAATRLFAALHKLDATGAEVIAVSPIPHIGMGVAINDRLNRAAAER